MKKPKTYSLLVYVEDASTKVKKFATPKAMGKFIDDFVKKHPDYTQANSDNWIDFAITDISGDVHFFTDSISLE